MHTTGVVGLIVLGLTVSSGCQSTPPPQLLPAPPGTSAMAMQRNEEGIQAYEKSQWAQARQHFEGAIAAAPDLAESHYNLGKTLYKLGLMADGDRHFIQAANLAPGHKIIWDSPPLRRVYVPSKEMPLDSHGHQH